MRLTEAEYAELMRRRNTPAACEKAPPSAEPAGRQVATTQENALQVDFRLPWPPSTNTIWRSLRSGPMAGRVLLSKAGRDYRKSVAESVCEQNTGCVVLGGRVGVEIVLYPPNRRKLDIDNRCKALLDALTHAGLWHDDEQIDVLIVRREGMGGYAQVRAWGLE